MMTQNLLQDILYCLLDDPAANDENDDQEDTESLDHYDTDDDFIDDQGRYAHPISDILDELTDEDDKVEEEHVCCCTHPEHPIRDSFGELWEDDEEEEDDILSEEEICDSEEEEEDSVCG
ncbi:hypothetical protein BC941DRAFT_456291 [Chlamydoabsidia padenii]|nr:hypothetical protein BC941DRAFT_456291 [Chlamydoabsidia padenii]